MKNRYAIGVDIGGTNLKVALINDKGEIVKKASEPSGGDVRARLKELVRAFMTDEVIGVGIGIAGFIDKKEAKVITSHNLSVLDGTNFAELGFNVPVHVQNDANAAALGEKWLGAGKKYKNFVLITLGTGVGGGFIHDGKLLDVPFEIGHLSVEARGEKCPCGNYGCLELYCSAVALSNAAADALEQGRESMLRECCHGNIYNISAEEITRAAFDGDSLARELLKNAGFYLGVALSNITHLLMPEAIVITGGLTGAWEILVEEARRESSKRVLKGLMNNVEFMRSPLGSEDAGTIGAAAMVFDGQ
jgi:glucokinase